MFYVSILFLSSQLCSGWGQKPLQLSATELNFLHENNHPQIPWLALITLAHKDKLFIEKRISQISWRGKKNKTSLSGKRPRPSTFEAKATEIHHFPWHAQVIVKKKSIALCGGVLYSDRIVLTAAHCISESDDGTIVDKKQVHVILGSSYSNQGKKYKVCKISRHPGYLAVGWSYYYDVAMILLNTKLKFDKNIQPAKLIDNDNWRDPKFGFTVVGFSAESPADGEDDFRASKSKRLYKTRMRFVDSWRCNNAPNTHEKGAMPVPPHMFCMIGDRKSDCYGDPGSGVMWAGYIVGLVAVHRGQKCGRITMPSMYSDLNHLGRWIKVEAKVLQSSKTKC